jgi:hypothetical protein
MNRKRLVKIKRSSTKNIKINILKYLEILNINHNKNI